MYNLPLSIYEKGKHMDVSQILERHTMYADSAAYADKEESVRHLNGDILTAISKTLADTNGEKAQKGFVNMVADLYFVEQDLTASHFVNSMYKLEQSDWSYQAVPQSKAQNIQATEKPVSMRRAIALDFLMDNKRFLEQDRKEAFVQSLQGAHYTI